MNSTGKTTHTAAIVALVFCAFVATIILTMFSGIQYIDRDYGDGLMDALLQGRLMHSSLWKHAWRSFPPRNIPLVWFIDYKAMATAGAWIALAVWGIRFRWGKSWLAAGLACLPIIPIAFAITRFAMMGNTEPSICGPWAAYAHLGSLYTLAACMGCCILDIRKARQSQPAADAPVDAAVQSSAAR